MSDRAEMGHALGRGRRETITLLHDFFARTVELVPHHVAVEIPPGVQRPGRLSVTYLELATRANALALRLARFARPSELGVILLPRHSPDLFAAQLALLQSGSAYTCLDVSFPDGRVLEVLREAGDTVVVTDAVGAARLAELGIDAGCVIDVTLDTPAREAVEACGLPGKEVARDDSRLAYVIYTSGTTGRPKGVMIEHRGIVNLVSGDVEEFRLGSSDRVAQGSSPAYDSSVEEVWLAFASGATLVVMDDDASRLGPDLVAWLGRERITVFCPPPTLLRATGCEDPEAALPGLRLLYVGGEALPQDVADRWARGRRLVNGYGPTECTVTCVRADVIPGGPIVIGRPVPGVQAWVLDGRLEKVAPGERGELCIGGAALARGYRNQPDVTARAFVDHHVLGRIYRTGDLVHCDENGDHVYHGRLDAQVKLRGYRIELGAIESRLAACPGVRAAACAVQDGGAQPVLVAAVVPETPGRPPSPGTLRTLLSASLPDYMVPTRIGFVDVLPTTVGGKLNRAALPRFDGHEEARSATLIEPRTPMETRLEAAFREILRLRAPCCVTEDFFRDLGGDSLSAAMLVTRLRGDPETAWVTVRDIYETRSVERLAERAPAVRAAGSTPASRASAMRGGKPLLATVIQAVWLGLLLVLISAAAYAVVWRGLPRLEAAWGPVAFVLVLPWLGLAVLSVYAPFSLAAAVVTKRLLIGRYVPMRVPAWGGWYVRNWIVQSVVRLVPWRWLEGTEFNNMALRALGARIGKRVHLHRGVKLDLGGWDLLEIGDDVTVGQDAALRIAELEDGELVFGPVVLGDGVTLDTRSGVAGHTVLERDAYLAPLSSLSEGERVPAGEGWDGIPARPAGQSPARPEVTAGSRELSPRAHGMLLMAARAMLAQWLALPLEVMLLLACLGGHATGRDVVAWTADPAASWLPWLVSGGLCVLAVPVTLAMAAVACRALGRIPEGVASLWSTVYVRAWLKTALVDGASEWLSGTLFWPAWLRAAGMRVGDGCEISTIIDVVPEHIEIGPETFFADGIYLGGPRIHRGTVTFATTILGKNTFAGNHAVIPAGQNLPADVLFGVCTVANDRTVRPGSSWFGHPPFELPRREVVACDRSLTHQPSLIRFWNRVFWELLRFTLPVPPLIAGAAWVQGMARWADQASPAAGAMVVAPLLTLGLALILCANVMALKWILLGRVRPGQHPLWCCWCSRWDFLYVAWGKHAQPFLMHLEGTLLLSWFLRGMGMRLGRRVLLGPGFSQVVDPDMIRIEDDATVNAMFQAHTFEDRVLKIDYVTIRKRASVGSGAVPLYGADIGEGTRVTSHSVIMKRERLLPGLHYAGSPTRLRSG